LAFRGAQNAENWEIVLNANNETASGMDPEAVSEKERSVGEKQNRRPRETTLNRMITFLR
jgi:hypothetical protein